MGLNNGIDPAGKMVGEATSFFLATGAEPGAFDYERELDRLEMKVKAGGWRLAEEEEELDAWEVPQVLEVRGGVGDAGAGGAKADHRDRGWYAQLFTMNLKGKLG